jgi:uncharacterized protein (DUF1015 family)
MKKIEEYGIRVPEILLPKNIDVKSWSVIACDQYTQDLDYWKKAEAAAAGKPSTLNLILPEVYLGSPDKPERIEKIRKTMKEYLEGDVFAPARKSMIYIERKTAFGRMRRGLVTQIDLETYEWKPFSTANIRATEATIVERIPPRMEIRKGAPRELPHILLLVNDKEDLLVGKTGSVVKAKKPLYDGEIMCNGGSITGWAVETENEIAGVTEAVSKIAEKNRAADGSTFLFAVGDGNHSLATAKAVWEEYKKAHPGEKNHPLRYALVEIVNIYDTGLTFEPIHRVLFSSLPEMLIKYVSAELSGKVYELKNEDDLLAEVQESQEVIGFVYQDADGKTKYVMIDAICPDLAVSYFQPILDTFMSIFGETDIDFIHGSDEIFRLGKQENTIGILLPQISKDTFFTTLSSCGVLPRKSFSMGEASEKRFYLECRKIK